MVDPPIDQLIRKADGGDSDAATALFAALYRELHNIAERQLRHGGGDVTLGTTSLLHEAYLNISERQGVRFNDRAHFLAYASRAMRGLMIDYVRRRRAQKRGGEFKISAADTELVADVVEDVERLERLASALDALGEVDRELAQLVDLRFFCGFSLVEIAGIRGVSERTVQRDWRKARLLLHRTLQEP